MKNSLTVFALNLMKDDTKTYKIRKHGKIQDIIQVIKLKKVGFLLANLILGSYQKKIAKDLNTVAGQEMLQGINSAKETGAQLVLADRNIQTTFIRIWRELNLWEKCKLIFSLLFSFIAMTMKCQTRM